MKVAISLLVVVLLTSGCAGLGTVGIGSSRSAKLPISVCPDATLTLEDGWSAEGERTSLTLADRRTLDAWILAWQDCAKKRGGVIEEANR